MPRQKVVTNIGKTARIMLSEDSLSLPKMMLHLISLSDRKNIVHLNGHLKQQIAKKQKSKTRNYLDTYLTRFSKQNLIIRIGESTYMINPMCAFKCSNAEFLRLLEDYNKYANIVASNKVNHKKQTKEILPDNVIRLKEAQ